MESSFLTPLLAEQLTSSDWRLHADLRYQSAVLGKVITVPAGFVTDFASVPRLPFAYLLAGATSVKPSVVHDFLYRSRPHECTRAQADAVLREGSLAIGEPSWRCWMMWFSVRMFGSAAWAAENTATSGRGNARALGREASARPPGRKAAKGLGVGGQPVKELI